MNFFFWRKKKGYTKPDVEVVSLESENGFLAGSVQATTVVKELNIESKPFEVEEGDWYGNKPTFE